jgi:hypothetical protein
MKTKKFLIQIESGETTRWQKTPEELTDLIRHLIYHLCANSTTGAVPGVTVIKEN